MTCSIIQLLRRSALLLMSCALLALSAATVVLAPNAPPAERTAAQELQKYLALIAGDDAAVKEPEAEPEEKQPEHRSIWDRLVSYLR